MPVTPCDTPADLEAALADAGSKLVRWKAETSNNTVKSQL